MEQNLPVMAKKVWRLVRVVYYMLRKGISKRKLLLDLNLMMKRGKIAGKALQNLMFHHHPNWAAAANRRSTDSPTDIFAFQSPPGEYEFSCSNSPAYPHSSLFSFHHRKHHAPPTATNNDEEQAVVVNAAVVMKAALEMLGSETASPALPGFGRSPVVRQLRVTDSPFPLHEDREDNHVDEAAEKFIMDFHKYLRRQNLMSSRSVS